MAIRSSVYFSTCHLFLLKNTSNNQELSEQTDRTTKPANMSHEFCWFSSKVVYKHSSECSFINGVGELPWDHYARGCSVSNIAVQQAQSQEEGLVWRPWS